MPHMDLISISFGLGVGLALGLLFGRIYWKKGDGALQERIRVLEDQGRGLQDLLHAERDSVLGLNRKLAGLEAVMPQLEGTAFSVSDNTLQSHMIGLLRSPSSAASRKTSTKLAKAHKVKRLARMNPTDRRGRPALGPDPSRPAGTPT